MRAKEAERAAAVFRKKQQDQVNGQDDAFFDSKVGANKEVFNILSKAQAAAEQKEEVVEAPELVPEDGDGWGGDEEPIDMGELALPEAAADAGTEQISADPDVFVPPSVGADPIKQALKKYPQSVGLHVAAGDFGKALVLLKRQLGVSNFEPLKAIFVDAHTLTQYKA